MKTAASRLRLMISIIGVVLASHAVVAQTPSWQWTRTAGSIGMDGAGFDRASSVIATDTEGNSYVTGTFHGDATFGTVQIPASGHSEIFVAKYSASGACLWVDHFGGTFTGARDNEGTGICIDGVGNCYVTATFTAKAGSTVARFGPNILIGTDHHEICVVKYGPTGTRLWGIQPSTMSYANNYSRAIACDAAGNTWVTGYAGLSMVFGSTLLGSGSFVLHCNPLGAILWSVKVGDGGVDANSIAVTPSGRSTLTGTMQGNCFLNSAITPSLPGIGIMDVFVANLGPTGTMGWIRRHGTAGGITWGRCVRTDNAGNAYVVGDYDKAMLAGGIQLTKNAAVVREAFIMKYAPTGTILWVKQTSSSAARTTTANAVIAKPNGEFAVCGTFNGATAIAGMNIPSTPVAQHCYVAKFSSSGYPLWSAVSSSPDNGLPEPHGMSIDGLDNYYLGGNIQGVTAFGSTTAAPYGGYDVFLSKLGPSAKICGQKLLDVNCNGVKDSTDAAIPHWTFQLIQQPTVLATVTSDDRGYFCFDNLPFGTYTVQEVPQNGYMPGNPASGSFIVTIDSAHTSVENLLFLNCTTSVHRECLDFEGADSTTTNWVTDYVGSTSIDYDSINHHVIHFVDGSGPSIAVDNHDFAGNWLIQGQNGCICFDYKVDWNESFGSNAGSAPKLYIYTGAPITQTSQLSQRIRAFFVGNSSLSLISDNVWNHFCLPIGVCGPGSVLPSNQYGTWIMYDASGALITDPVVACSAWNSLITTVTGLVLCTDYNNQPSEDVYFDNFCWECAPSCSGEEVGSVIIDSACCSGSVQILNLSGAANIASFSPISEISYSIITGGAMKAFSVVGACATSATSSPSNLYGTSSGTISFASPYCASTNFYVNVELLSTAPTTSMVLRVKHANGTMCTDTVALHCSFISPSRCDLISVEPPVEWLFTGRSGRHIDIQNMLVPASSIRWVKIATSTLPDPSGGQVQWQGDQLTVDGQMRDWTINGLEHTGVDVSPGIRYSRIRFQNGFQELPECQTDMSFNLSIGNDLDWTGQCTITVGHANGSTCERTFDWCALPDSLCPSILPSYAGIRPYLMSKLVGGSVRIPGADGKKIRFATISVVNAKRARLLAITAPNKVYDASDTADTATPAVTSSSMGTRSGMIEFRALRSARESVDFSYMLVRTDSADTSPIDLHLALLDEQANPVVTRTVQASTDITSVPDTGVLTRFSDGPRLLGTIPSPIATQAVIRFWSPSTQSIRLELFDIIGDRVATIADGPANEGVNTVRMDASSLLPGTYLVRLTAGSSVSTTTVVIVR